MHDKNKAKESLKNTGLVGGSKVITILIGIVRTKFVAILLGPGGIGLIQLFTSTISLVSSVAGLGIGFSGVRDISESIGSGDDAKISKTITTLKRWSWVTGALGVLLTILFSKKLSEWTFGNEDYWFEISVLSCTILFANIAAGYKAVIRGTRRMADYAKIIIIAATVGTVVSILIYYLFGEHGIVPVIIITGIITLVVNFIYSKKINYQKVKISYKESFSDGLSMVQLGVFTVITGFISQMALYYVRISINDNLGIEEVGYYAVATTLAVNYMGLIFSSMSADYFPKLSAINKDNKAINEAVVEQTKIVLLLGTPLLIGMYTFSEYIIKILYTEEFALALPLLKWMLLSVFLRLIGFPIGYVFLAKGKSKIFIFTQSLWHIIFVSLVFLSWENQGELVGIGMAYVVAGILGVFVNIIIIKNMTGMQYDSDTLIYISLFAVITLSYFYISTVFSGWMILILKILGLIGLSIYCFKHIERLVKINILRLIRSKLSKK